MKRCDERRKIVDGFDVGAWIGEGLVDKLAQGAEASPAIPPLSPSLPDSSLSVR